MIMCPEVRKLSLGSVRLPEASALAVQPLRPDIAVRKGWLRWMSSQAIGGPGRRTRRRWTIRIWVPLAVTLLLTALAAGTLFLHTEPGPVRAGALPLIWEMW